jgi:hypothetical protein
VNDIATGAPLDILAANAAPVVCVPAIMELDLLPEMGRMTRAIAPPRRDWILPVQLLPPSLFV